MVASWQQSGDEQPAATPDEQDTPPVRRSARDPQVQLSFRVPRSLRRRLKLHAARTDRPVQQVAAQALREYLDRHEP